MKELLINEQGVTFTSALKSIKSASSINKTSQSTLKSSRCNLSKRTSFTSMISSNVRITERKNLTLKQLYREYENNSNIYYVIRSTETAVKRGNSPTFDSWIGTFTSGHKQLQINSISKSSQTAVLQREIPHDKLKRQISDNIQKLTERFSRKQTQTTQQSYYEETSPLSRQTKYSFSNYFSECSEIQNKDNSFKPQIATKISLASNEHTDEDEVVQDLIHSKSKQEENVYLTGKFFKDSDKENVNFNANVPSWHQAKVVGLEFSKKKCFKSTKRNKKVES